MSSTFAPLRTRPPARLSSAHSRASTFSAKTKTAADKQARPATTWAAGRSGPSSSGADVGEPARNTTQAPQAQRCLAFSRSRRRRRRHCLYNRREFPTRQRGSKDNGSGWRRSSRSASGRRAEFAVWTGARWRAQLAAPARGHKLPMDSSGSRSHFQAFAKWSTEIKLPRARL